MTRAIIRAGGSLAPFSFVSFKAIAFSRGPIANTTAGTLGVLVAAPALIRGVYPGELEWANTVGAISVIMRQSHAPVVIALAEAALAKAVSAAGVVAASVHNRRDG